MNIDELRQLADQHLVPFFSGASLETRVFPSSSREQSVAFKDPCTVAFKLNKNDAERLHLRRSQPFIVSGAARVSEKHVIDAFIEVLRSVEPGLSEEYRVDLLNSLERRVVGKSITPLDLKQAYALGVFG